MAIIVDKEEKRRAIALASKELLLEHGIKNITISKIAACAGVGKGTIYGYFNNKEDIVFEIISVFIAEHEKALYALIDEDITTKEKIRRSLSMLYSNAEYEKQLSIYREFLAISLTSNIEEMIAFSRACRTRFETAIERIINEAIDKGDIKPQAKAMTSTLHTYSIGLVVDTKTNALEPQEHIDAFVEALFALIENKDIK
ncbi:MAG: TetR family transcriptional regulator [uncultured Sulfurovum sp.]|uniref:TetR family transcriptional regulator n=1 Tax=uncultured Sulfurovum sp. TaxID=269237 RepID=A0A6S6SRE3_9BACT|nr:MAG: TetR family transcriptional regulator [uncultured Sulfurovum sp.]